MKKTRILLTVFAFVLAIGAALASHLNPLVQGYIYVPLTDQCVQSSKNCSGDGSTCMDGTRIVFDTGIKNGTSCGTALKHTN